MGLRADVTHELKALDTSTNAMRKFGLMVGGVFLAIAAFGIYKHWSPAVISILGLAGMSLVIGGALFPQALPPVHRVWMTFALALGWCMSRLILTILFVFAIIPMALLGRVMKLPYTQIRRTTPRDTYWVDHPARSNQHHTDMF